MPDSKITALASTGTGTDPANDPLVIVDVSDTSMAASGTTKKVTLNNLLACSPTATLASATITGDLTVRTNKLFVNATGVGIGTTTLFNDFSIQNGSNCRMEVTSSSTGIAIENLNNARNAYLNMTMYADAYIWNRLGTTAMTLNATGLGVGVASPTAKLDIAGAIKSTGDITSSGGKFATGASGQTVGFQLDSFVSGGVFNNYILNNASAAGTNATLHFGRLTSILYGFIRSDNNTQNIEIGTAGTARLTIDQSGNIILATPSTPPSLATNGQLTVNATSNTNLRFSYRGSDGTTRVANITLA